MNLEIGDLTDCIKKYPKIVEYIKKIIDDEKYVSTKKFLKNLSDFEGGKEIEENIIKFLKKYDCRGPCEIGKKIKFLIIKKKIKIIKKIFVDQDILKILFLY
jgi:hypothetical protein